MFVFIAYALPTWLDADGSSQHQPCSPNLALNYYLPIVFLHVKRLATKLFNGFVELQAVVNEWSKLG